MFGLGFVFFSPPLRKVTLNILVLRALSKDVRLILPPRLPALEVPPLEERAQAARAYNLKARMGIAAPRCRLLFGSVEQTRLPMVGQSWSVQLLTSPSFQAGGDWCWIQPRAAQELPPS